MGGVVYLTFDLRSIISYALIPEACGRTSDGDILIVVSMCGGRDLGWEFGMITRNASICISALVCRQVVSYGLLYMCMYHGRVVCCCSLLSVVDHVQYMHCSDAIVSVN